MTTLDGSARCRVMGIVNVTPDSFSDGGRYYRPEEAIRRAMNMVDEGAGIIDLGGESTRPGSVPIGWEAEWERIGPVVAGLSDRLAASGVGLSVDTYHPETAERAVAAGATIVNCVYAEPVPEMLRVVADAGENVELVVPSSVLDVQPVARRLLDIAPRIYLDPMIGFGTTREEDVALLRAVPELAKKGRVLVGASRKRIVQKLTGEKRTGKNLGGSVGVALWCAAHGASVVRVHDVVETVQAIRAWSALAGQ